MVLVANLLHVVMQATVAFRYLSVADEVPQAARGGGWRLAGDPAVDRPSATVDGGIALLDSPRRRIRRAHTFGDRITGVPRLAKAGR